ncbi:protein binding protein, putative [Ricinus communis]|uniref:Protein binding protein, putative n=1 Tax=Ricinus communis TaxID=3988 RepID=B9R9X9_RICCO|nr:protein binding protein, putative [Ricinus communis]
MLATNDFFTTLEDAIKRNNMEEVKLSVTNNPELLDSALQFAWKHNFQAQLILVSSCKESIAKENLQNETALHVALKSHQCRVFEVLVEEIKKLKQEEILNRKDDEGNTVLHIAAKYKLTEIVKLLLPSDCSTSTFTSRAVMRVNTLNRKGEIALDVYHQNGRDITSRGIGLILYEAGAVEGRLVRQIETQESLQSPLQDRDGIGRPGWSLETRNVLLVVLVMIAGAAFGMTCNIPAVFLKEKPSAIFSASDVISGRLPGVFYLLVLNTAGFVMSMFTIIVLVSSLPFWTVLLFLVITVFIVYFLVVEQNYAQSLN